MKESVDVNCRDFRLEWHITDTGLYTYMKRYSFGNGIGIA
jgi:hypothetical protein